MNMRTMMRWWWAAAVAAGVAAQAQNEPAAGLELEETRSEPWRVVADGIFYSVLYQHDALQTRADFEEDRAESWRRGDASGNGWGLRLAVAKGDGAASVRFINAEFDYERREPGGYHEIENIRNDLELLWSQRAGATESSQWGWDIGYRYIGVTKRMTLVERHDDLRFSENTNYHMLQAGYFGRWQPFKGPNLGVYALIRGMIGEASGFARRGSDDKWDGQIRERYDDDYSLAYGARAEFGVNWDLRNGLRASLSYHREWIYSFDSTDSGLVVFPDNSDALFIENVHAVMFTFGYAF